MQVNITGEIHRLNYSEAQALTQMKFPSGFSVSGSCTRHMKLTWADVHVTDSDLYGGKPMNLHNAA